jgi:hypothetical protein
MEPSQCGDGRISHLPAEGEKLEGGIGAAAEKHAARSHEYEHESPLSHGVMSHPWDWATLPSY